MPKFLAFRVNAILWEHLSDAIPLGESVYAERAFLDQNVITVQKDIKERIAQNVNATGGEQCQEVNVKLTVNASSMWRAIIAILAPQDTSR